MSDVDHIARRLDQLEREADEAARTIERLKARVEKLERAEETTRAGLNLRPPPEGYSLSASP